MDNEPEKNIEEDKIQEFVKKFEDLVKEYNISKYVFIPFFSVKEGETEKQLILYRSKEITEITRILHMAHIKFRQEVMRLIGESA